MNSKLTVFLFLMALIVVVVVGFLLSSSNAPALPYPLNASGTTYTIVKNGNYYRISYRNVSNSGEIMIGNSEVSLEQYIGKEVLINGAFPKTPSELPQFTRAKQCIQGDCLAFSNNIEYVVEDISSISLAVNH